MRLPIRIFGLLAALQARCRADGVDESSADEEHRLPDDTAPESYTLAVDPDRVDGANGSFQARVEISIRVMTTTDAITLNARDLDLREIEIADEATNRVIGLRSWRYDAARERTTIDVDGHVLAGRKYVVRIRFGGRLRDDATGFFRTVYQSGSGEKKWLVATQFKKTQARRAFPCYDEPRFRTPFNVSIKTDNNEIALSNMPILNTENINETESQNSTWVHFMQTPAIPTFLVSYFVGEFERLDKSHQSMINVYSHLGNLYQIEYINRATSSLLKVIENYTNIKYTLPKLDLLALPELSLDAVEQCGLNTYREKSLFVDKNTKTETKVLVKMLVEKVMANQWFTGLVTPSQWDFAWLNEGFATYLKYFATATLEPDWRLEQFFVVKELQRALEHDQYSNNAIEKMDGKFDGMIDKISSTKGAAIFRMLNDWVGDEVFKRALNIFLTKNQYTVFEPQHLWNAFDNALFELNKSNLHGKNVHTIINTWVEQVGYPVVNVAKKDKSLILTQKRFSIRSLNANDNTKWFIRLTYTNDKVKNFDAKSAPSVWMEPAALETTVSIANDEKWYIFNLQSIGYCRVNYTEDNWASLTKQLETSPTDIDVSNRAQLIDDSFNLARAGQLNYTVPLGLTRYLDKEDDIFPWFSVMDNLNYVLDRMRQSEEEYTDTKAFVSKLAGVAFQKVNKLVAESRNIRYPNNIALNAFSTWACELDENNCVTMALNYFRRWRNGEEIPADFKDAAFCTGIRHSTEDGDWTKMLELYQVTKTYSEKESALNALTCTENVQLLITNLEQMLTKQCSIEPRDYKAFFKALSLKPNGIVALTFFLQNHFTHILQNVTNGESMVVTIYSTLASKVSTEHETLKMSEIARTSPLPYAISDPSSPLIEHYERIETNRKWFDTHSKTIREFINPGSTLVTESTPAPTTQNPSKHGSSASSRLESCVVLLQIFALSVSVKLLVRVG